MPDEEIEVYPPSEDTFILIKVAKNIVKKHKILEIGTGSGVVLKELAKHSSQAIGTDISFAACKLAKEKCSSLNNVDIICCDAASCLRGEIVDIVVSNPPYLPLGDGNPMWDGGKEGIEIPLKFAKNAYEVLKDRGVLVIILSSLSNIRRFITEADKLRLKLIYSSTVPIGLMEQLVTLIMKKVSWHDKFSAKKVFCCGRRRTKRNFKAKCF